MNNALAFAVCWLGFTAGCSDGDYTLERKGGPFPTSPVTDPVGGSEGSGGSAPSDAGAGGAGEVPVEFCAALNVVRAKCQRCHGDPQQNGAPVAFLTVDDFQEPYFNTEFKWWEIAADRVEKDAMPYVELNDPPTSLMPQVERLTVDEKSTLVGWLKQGALPEGGTDCP